MVDGQGEVVAVHSPDVTLEGVVAGKAGGGGVAACAGVGQGAGVGPGETQQGHITDQRIRDKLDLNNSIPDPGSRVKQTPDPGSKRHRIPDPDPQQRL